MSSTVWVIIAFIIYASLMIFIGMFFFRKSNNISDYFLGGRKLNPWVAALSAQASDMSGWLLMGLPGAVYAAGTGRAWIAIGLAAGTILNWLFVAKRLRRYTIVAKNSITLPEFFENRFHNTSGVLRVASALFITIFFAVYTASGFVAGGTLFSQVFGIDYQTALIIGTAIILIYTFLGGFAAVCWTDLIQGLIMLVAIFIVPIIAIATFSSGETSALIPADFLNMMTDGSGGKLSVVSIISDLAWGLGYFGMPHILVRFMAIKSEKGVLRSAAIAIVWVIITLIFAVIVGLIGIAFLPGLENTETVFIQMIQKIFMAENAVVPVPIIGGFLLCAILAAIMSTADSQLLVTSSSMVGDIYKRFDKKASNKKLLWISRGAVVFVAIAAYLIAVDPNSSIMDLVANAWSGFGSAFGSLVILSLYWKRINGAGAAAGIISGGLTVIIWDYIPIISGETLGGTTGLYSLIPGFFISFAAIIIVSLASKAPSSEMSDEFEKASIPLND